MIILNETEWAAAAIGEKNLGKHPSDTMRMIARYYIDNGLSRSEVAERMVEFLQVCMPDVVVSKWKQMLTSAYKAAQKQPAVDIDSVVVTKGELAAINALPANHIRQKRLAFTLLCLAKYWRARNAEYDNWVLTTETDTMEMANIRASMRERCKLFHDLNEAGLIRLPRKVDGKFVQVCFAEDDGEPALTITDFRNLGNQYMMYNGQPFFVCANCGAVTKIDNPKSRKPQKYCHECAGKVQIRQNIASVMRCRQRVNS